MKRMESVAIVGAGVAGLTAAYELSKAGCRVTVLEQRDEVGGLARSVVLDGAPIERYYHFICGGDEDLKELIGELGLGERLHWRPSRTSYYVEGALYPFTTPVDILRFSPISPASRIRFGLHGVRARRFTDWTSIEHQTAEEWIIAGGGRQAYEVIWRPLLEMKFGSALGAISAPWLWHRIHRYATSRKGLFRPDDLGYLEGGSATLLSALTRRIEGAGGEVRLGCPVRSLVENLGRISGVITDDGELEADAVISTAPLPALSLLLPPAAAGYKRALDGIRFVGVVCLLARTARSLTNSFWVNVSDSRAPFNGIVEYGNLNARADMGDRATLYIPLYMPQDDPRFTRSDADLAEELFAGLSTLFPDFERSQVGDWLVTRDSYAQALCPPGFSARVPSISSPLPGLFVTDSTQLYPADRNISGTIGLAQQAARLCLTGGR